MNLELSELAQQVYAVFVRKIASPAAYRGYVVLGELEQAVGRALAHNAIDAEGEHVLDELVSAGLIDEVPSLGSRYRLSIKAWQRIVAERTVERDAAVDALTLSVEVVRALLRVNDGKPLGDELRGHIMRASEAAAQVLPPGRE